jgi:hypothetical protein
MDGFAGCVRGSRRRSSFSTRGIYRAHLLRFSADSDLHNMPRGIRLPMYRPSFANFVACFLPAIDFKNERPRFEARILNVDFAKMEIAEKCRSPKYFNVRQVTNSQLTSLCSAAPAHWCGCL